jgi:hypothetical protein
MKIRIALVVVLVAGSLAFVADVVRQAATPQEQVLWTHSQNDVNAIEDGVKKTSHEQIKTADAQSRAEPILTLANAQPRADVDNVEGSQSSEDVYERQGIKIQRQANRIQRQANGIQRAIAFFTLALVVIGGLVGWRQMQILAKQMEIMAKQTDQMEAATRYAGAAAIAAEVSAKVAQETLQTTQRAYLGLENWRFKYDDAGIPLRIECTLFNSGATQAEIIGSAFRVYITGELPPPPEYSQITIDPMKPMLIHPKREHTYSVKLADLLKNAAIQDPTMDTIMQLMSTPVLTAELLKRVLQGTSPLYLGGCLVYKTVGLCRMLVLFIQYEAALNRFAAVGEAAYNYETPCNDKECPSLPESAEEGRH